MADDKQATLKTKKKKNLRLSVVTRTVPKYFTLTKRKKKEEDADQVKVPVSFLKNFERIL